MPLKKIRLDFNLFSLLHFCLFYFSINYTDNGDMLQVQKIENIPLFAMFETIKRSIASTCQSTMSWLTFQRCRECSTLQRGR